MIERIGFPCVLHSSKRSTNHGFRLGNLSHEKLSRTVGTNLDDMEFILGWMDAHQMRLFRIGSSLVPFASHPEMNLDWRTMVADRLANLGETYRKKDFRFSLHPGQYNVLNSENTEVVRKTVAELAYSCTVLELMGLDASHKVVLHGGCRCGDMDKAVDRLSREVDNLPQRIRSRLVLENDERIFTPEHILTVSRRCGVPAVFDIHHHRFHPGETPLPELMPQIRETWREPDGRPKLHLSSRRPDARHGAHADTVEAADVRELCDAAPFDFDLMIEAKHKEVAAQQAMQAARDHGCLDDGRREDA